MQVSPGDLFPVVGPGGVKAATVWFVIPVMPGLFSQIKGFFVGSSGAYKVVQVTVGSDLYNQYTAAGYGPPYPTKAAADKAAAQFAASGAANRLQPSSPGQIQGSGVQSGPPIPGLSAFFHLLSQRETWIRVAEVGLGVALIAVALGHMTGVGTKTPVMKALKVAKGVSHKSAPVSTPSPGPRSTPQGRHAKTGPNAPAQGKHAR